MMYYIEWFEPSYSNCEPKTVDLSWFTDDIGYTPEDREEIELLKIGQHYWLDLCDHKVTRVS